MDTVELLERCADIKGFPRVQYLGPHTLRHSSNQGIITGIKKNGKYHGCSVQFDGVDYDTWFYDSNDTDNRSRYMRDLEFVNLIENQKYSVVPADKLRKIFGILDGILDDSDLNLTEMDDDELKKEEPLIWIMKELQPYITQE